MKNVPTVKVGIVAVSRDCFPIELSIKRRKALVEAYVKEYGEADIYECPICIFESEIDITGILFSVIRKKFPNFAVRISELMENPVRYY